jgi:Asp-tRNA(Asn)/Glu-tRNA(Gln) amidotransferase A subunit family amidase
MKRREAVKAIVAAGLLGGTGADGAETTPPDVPTDAIMAADIAAADKIVGRSHSAAEREQMVRRVARNRDELKAVREVELGAAEPAAQFDPRLPGTRTPRGKNDVRVTRGPTPVFSGSVESLAFLSVVELSRLIRARKVTSTELTRMYLERLKRFDPALNCVVTLTEELALEQAVRADREIAAGHIRGPLHGIPWGAKDLLATRGIPTTWGARPYQHQVFDKDATVVQRLTEAGAVLIAKLSLGELAQGDVWFGGRTKNPWRPREGSSGSSAGPASATAAGLVGFSIGSETLGSIVSPSVTCGVTGLRPTYGRVSRAGAMALCWTLDKIGPICRGVEDCALVLGAIHGPDGRDGTVADIPFRWDPRARLSEIRVGYDVAAFDSLKKNAAQKKVYDEVLATLRRLGIELRPVTLPPSSSTYESLGMLISVESAASFEKLTTSGRAALLERQGPDAWPNTFRVGATVPAVDYLQLLRVRRQLQGAMAAALRDVDVYVTVPFAGPTLLFTNFTGHPSVVTRCGMRSGRPQSVEFIGGLYQEAAALRVALANEQATDWHTQWPDMRNVQPG